MTPVGRRLPRALGAAETVALDVAAGALGAALFLVGVSGAGPVPWPILGALAAAVLVVYNVDHLLDSYHAGPPASPRRRRYRAHRRWLAGVALGAAVGGGVSAYFLPASAWRYGLPLAGYQVAYFVALRRGLRGAGKRVAAAVGWTAGIALPAWCAGARRSEWLFGAGILALLAWINLQSYAAVESRGEAEPAPHVALRALALGLVLILVVGAWRAHPEQVRRWLALLGVAGVQALLVRAPLERIHPLGEWTFALLGLLLLG